MDEVTRRIDSLSTARRALLDALLAGGDHLQRPRTGPVPASFAQQRLWTIDQLDPGNPAYNCPIMFRLGGRLDRLALHRALRELTRRHESLRTTFRLDGDQLMQVVHPEVALPLPVTDCSESPPTEREAALRRIGRQDALCPFDLAAGPVLRARLVLLGEQEHALLVDIHHIANDGASTQVFLRELATCYDAYSAGHEPRLPELPCQYADYTRWQRERLSGPVRHDLLAFWRDQLAGLAPAELPTDRPRPSVFSSRGALAYAEVPASTVSALRALGRAEGATLFMAMLAGFAALLWRYTGCADVAVGTTVSGRDRAEAGGLIGLLVNTVVVRSDVAGNPTFRELLRRVRGAALNAYANAELPFDLLVRELSPPRDTSRNPLVSTMFTLDETPRTPLRLGGLTATLVETDMPTAKLDLVVGGRPEAGGIRLQAQYSAELFDRSTVRRLLRHYRLLLESAAEQPDRRIGTLAVLDGAERSRVLHAGNDTEVVFPRERCLHELIQAWSHSGTIALTFGRERLSHRELHARANRLAWHLRGLGVGPDVPVAIGLEPSVELVVAILAVLKAGGAYVPLEPDQPVARRGLILAQSAPPVLITTRLITTRPLSAYLPDYPGRVVLLDEAAAVLMSHPSNTPPNTAAPGNLAYVFFTSGSTGTPKGAMNTHEGVVNRLCWMQRAYPLGTDDVVLQKTPYGFDVSVWEFLWPLLAGARLVIAAAGVNRDPGALCELIHAERVSTLHFVPSMLREFLEQPELDSRCGSLRRVICSGEALTPELRDRCLARLPTAELQNLYGPTEAAIDVTAWDCLPATEAQWNTVPIGRPIANTRIYLLDEWLEPVPDGVPGELCIGGIPVGRGYLRRPGLTADRFVPDSFGSRRGGRLYRTGDRARRLPDGSLEFLGRLDDQVKIRGFRVEPGEVEAALRGLDGVRDAAVLARPDRNGETRLRAYVTPSDGEPLDPARLHHQLRLRLPHFLVPAGFVSLDCLPRLPSGKLNRQALPDGGHAPEVDGVAPRDELEHRVAEHMLRVLDIPRIGIDDDFFELGGDSIRAIRLARALGGTLAVIEVFQHPTVRTLAALLPRDGEQAAGAARMLHRLTGSEAPVALSALCIPYGGGHAGVYRAVAERLPVRVALWSVALPGHDPGRPDERLLPVAEVADRCADEAAHRLAGPLVVYGHCAGVVTALEVARKLEQCGMDVRAVLLGAALPDPDPDASLARAEQSSDADLEGFLRLLGGFHGALDPDDATAILRAFRHDMTEAIRFFQAHRGAPWKINAPIRCVVGGSDPATPDAKEAFRGWQAFADSVDLTVLAGAGHYFPAKEPDQVADLLLAELGDTNFRNTAPARSPTRQQCG